MALLKFVNQGEDGLPRKRKTAAQACDSCRRRKKRCTHLDSLNGQSESPPSKRKALNDLREGTTQIPASPADSIDSGSLQDDNVCPTSRGPQEVTERHWIGDMNPESVLLAATSPDAIKRGDNIGFWVTSPRNGTQIHSKLSLRQPRSNKLYFSDPLIQQLLLPYLEDQCLSLLPPEPDLAAICRIYRSKVHPLFPVIIDEANFDPKALGDPASILLKQAMCLAVSKERDAAAHLRLPPDTAVLQSLEDYSQKITTAMRTVIDLGLVTDKRVMIQVYCLMSLFADNTDGGDLVSQYAARAINHLNSLAIHIIGCAGPAGCGGTSNTPAGGQAAVEPTKSPASPNSRLFCCCWLLDRLNSAFHGRAVLMNERDWTRDLNQSIANQEPCFQLFLRIGQVFDTVIDFYRPANREALKGWDHEFPDFEQLVVSSDAWKVDMPLLAALETFYHTVAILSHRQRSMDNVSRSSASFLRRTHSAGRITTIVGEEFKDQLPMFPHIPYAVSLCISVGYSELRHSKVPLHQARARNQLLANCKILKELGKGCWSASMVAELAEQLVHEVDRAVSAAAGNGNHQNANTSSHQDSSRADTARAVPVAVASVSGDTALTEVSASLPDATFPAGLDSFDVFDHFDPEFDLAAIDNAFIGNLDLSFPTAFNVA